MSTITTIVKQLFYIYSNPNYTYPNNYKVKKYYTNNKTNNKTNNETISNLYVAHKPLPISNIDYNRYKLFTFINNNQIISNLITNN